MSMLQTAMANITGKPKKNMGRPPRTPYVAEPVIPVRTCKACGETKPLRDFGKSGVVDGQQLYRHTCKPCVVAKANANRHVSDELKRQIQIVKLKLQLAELEGKPLSEYGL